MATHLELLLAQRAAATADLAEQRAVLRKARRQERQTAAAQARHWQLDSHQRHVAVVAYVFAGYMPEAAARFLAVDAERRRWPPKPEEELWRLVEEVFLETSVAELSHLCDTERPGEPTATVTAVRYVEEWRLVVWARRRCEPPVGAAPTTAAVLRQAEANRLRVPMAIRPPSLGLECDVRARLWASRWRERWEGHFGEVPVRPPFTPEEGRPKVLCICCGHVRGLAVVLGDQIFGMSLGWNLNEGRPSVHKGRGGAGRRAGSTHLSLGSSTQPLVKT